MEVEGMELAFEGVSVTRGSSDIRVSGSFGRGIHLVSGRVGSGKSTIAAMAAGLLSPDVGTIHRKEVSTAMLSFQFPESGLTGSTVQEEVHSFGLDNADTLAMAGLSGRGGDDPLSLSRGELKKLSLACVLSRPWDLCILDGPFEALDCSGKREVCRWIEQRRSSIVILCTHEQHILPRIDALWEFQEHTLVFRGPVPESLVRWDLAPASIKTLVSLGTLPVNISEDDIREAVCRIQG